MITKPQNYKDIRNAASVYQLHTFSFKGQIGNPGMVDFDNIPLIVFMEKANVERLLSVPDCKKLAAVMNVEDDHFTIALLCADDKNRILPAHVEGKLDGEETWPTMIKISEQDAIDDFLQKPKF